MLEYYAKGSVKQMASSDIYLRKDIYEADQRTAKAEAALRDNEILKAIERLRIEVNGKIEEFRIEVNDRFNQVDKRIDKLESRVDVLSGRMDGFEKRIDGFEKRMDVFEKRMDGFDSRLDSRLSNIQTYVGLGIAFITMIITLYTFLAPVMKAAKNFLEHFGKETKRDTSPGLTAEQVREIFRSEAEAIISSKLKAIR